MTDRRRLAGEGLPFERLQQRLLDQIAAAVRDGVDIVQIRERDLEAADLAALLAGVVSLTRGTSCRVVINDRLDVAMAGGADGVHLRGDSIHPSQARRMAPSGFLIGLSVHTTDEAVRARDCDYLVAGTVFPSASKSGRGTLLGLDGLRAVVQAARVPVLAIGGVTPDRFHAIAATGAAGVAGIGLFLPCSAPGPAS